MTLSPTMREKLTTPRPKDKMTTHLPIRFAQKNEALFDAVEAGKAARAEANRRAIAMVERLGGEL